MAFFLDKYERVKFRSLFLTIGLRLCRDHTLCVEVLGVFVQKLLLIFKNNEVLYFMQVRS
jgi:hypothetical protein